MTEATLKVPYFDGAELTLGEEVTEPGARAALDAFLALTPADRIADSRHVYAYYQDFREAVGGEDWMDEEIGVPKSPEDIWLLVRPGRLYVDQDYDERHWYVSLSSGCDWEEEHGLLMVWRDGTRLTRVSGNDGHVTNSDAYADEGMGETIYSASNPQYTTRLDPAGPAP